MKIDPNDYPLPISKKLVAILTDEIRKAGLPEDTGVVLNFRDKSYSPEGGGFHPVEIAIGSDGRIQYITDFAYFGPLSMAELDKDLDFDFQHRHFRQYGAYYPIAFGKNLFGIWQSNFCAYYEAEAFDEIKVSPWP